MSSESDEKSLPQYATDLAMTVANEVFDMHLEMSAADLVEADRENWTHGFVAGFTSGFTTAAMRANAVVSETINRNSAQSQPGAN